MNATDTTGATASTTFGWTVNAAGGECTGGGELLANPGFESGSAAPWTAAAGVVSTSATEPPHGGQWDARLDGHGNTHIGTLSQTVTLPAGCSAYNAGFWLHVDTAETSTTVKYGTLTVQLVSLSGAVLDTLASYYLDHTTGYTSTS
ncbi:MAG: hypothetical protein QOJ50_3767 [Cryptosporangiaceae bacterium]|nr:hypothetical protein [Cryptosporangiaceae bacterium]